MGLLPWPSASIPPKNSYCATDRILILDSENGDTIADMQLSVFVAEISSLVVPNIVLKPAQAISFTIAIPAKGYLKELHVELDTGTPTFKAGTTENGDDLVAEFSPSSELFTWEPKRRSIAGETIYVTLGGSGSVNIRYELIPSFI